MMNNPRLHHQSQCVSFKLAHNLMGVNILDIREIVPCRKITPVAQAPGFVTGLMNLRGQILTVLDIGVLLGLEKRAVQAGSHVIVFKNRPVGFIVDRIGDVVGIDPQQMEAIPANIDPKIQEYMEHIIRLPDDILMLLDAAKLLSASAAYPRRDKES
jgi:purine-binding chemotaxis protein CheW